jgi:hypothetical protein
MTEMESLTRQRFAEFFAAEAACTDLWATRKRTCCGWPPSSLLRSASSTTRGERKPLLPQG